MSMTSPLNERPEMSDGQFADALDLVGERRQLALWIREATAILCKRAPGTLYPTDDTRQLAQEMEYQGMRGWDLMCFHLALEDAVGRVLPLEPQDIPPFVRWRFLWLSGSKCKDFGEWVRLLVAAMVKRQACEGQ
jgi:hypothetical protein